MTKVSKFIEWKPRFISGEILIDNEHDSLINSYNILHLGVTEYARGKGRRELIDISCSIMYRHFKDDVSRYKNYKESAIVSFVQLCEYSLDIVRGLLSDNIADGAIDPINRILASMIVDHIEDEVRVLSMIRMAQE